MAGLKLTITSGVIPSDVLAIGISETIVKIA
jgi:hypothetical protein